MPLAEEMNRCRRIVAIQSCVLAAAGLAVLCVDPYGCGDSDGEFAEADWQTWVKDLCLARDWLETKSGHKANLWAIRHGALLAAAAFSDTPPSRMVLWQPVVSGAAALREMLRVSVASSMLNASDKPTTVSALRAELLAGEDAEVGGYCISACLAQDLDAATLDPWPFTESSVEWMDIVPEGNDTTSPQLASVSDALRAPGLNIRHHLVPGRRFWSSPDVVECDKLISETLQVFAREASPT
jgi:exosortase A-associated hydrolase 2